MKKIMLFINLIIFAAGLSADEGMWLLKELNKESITRMQELGFKFPTDSIYSEDNASLKDAVVIFGAGCTGVAVSEQGLIFTNHHCGYDAIQKHSSVEADYLKDGFVSQSLQEELYSEGLEVCFLKKTEDITDKVLDGITAESSESQRRTQIAVKSIEILDEYANNEFLKARIIPFYSGNKYYLIVYEVFKDVRMVFAPPSSVGKFGGETDNWMWPRHTGDFSIFRVYADKNNNAAKYNSDNVPYKPQYHIPVSIKGYDDKGYAMTIGYSGRTNRYLTSWGITQMMESQNKPRIEVREAKQAIWKEAMNASDAIRIKYASKYARSSNYWKNSIGMNTALTKLKVIADKKALERQFTEWISTDNNARTKYGNTLPMLENAYEETMEPTRISTYFSETFASGIEIVNFAGATSSANQLAPKERIAFLSNSLSDMYKDYESGLDRKVTAALLKLYAQRVPEQYLPDIYKTINTKFKGDYAKYADWLFDKTSFTSFEKVTALFEKGNQKDIDKDPAMIFHKSVDACRKLISASSKNYNDSISKGSRLFMAGLMDMEPDKAFSPDANFTQRLSYGSIGGYIPFDAAHYDYFSTPKGILEKEKPGDPEFNIQQYILDNIRSENWGQYRDKDGLMHINFLSNNDITGGNSGSPVLDGNAHLIGLAFDGNWEALSGDIVFEPNLQRTINVDIRYVLYMIEKVMKCPRLINELDIVR